MSKAWGKYYENTKALKPSKFLVEALVSFDPTPGKAIDLGCGSGRDTKYLLEKGFEVSAVDKDPSAEDYLKQLPLHENLKFTCAGFEDYDYKNYDLVNAHYALPFIHKKDFNAVMNKILGSVKPKGLFIGQLFGVYDEWNTPDAKMTFCERADVDMLFRSFKHLEITEMDEEGVVANGNSKHWHVFNIIAQK